MKIAFYNIFGELKNAEQETLKRLQYVFKKQGHRLIVIDRDGYITSDCKEKSDFIEDADVDFLFTYNMVEFAQIALPDTFSVFLHWAPLGFVNNAQALLQIKMFHAFDYFGCTYERDIFKRAAQIKCDDPAFIGSSVPSDYVVPPQRMNKHKLFYVGINLERRLGESMRFGTLLERLDKTGQLEIYGPLKVFDQENLWAGFDSYRGEIPFDGHSVIEKINHAGICLALNSPMHNDVDAVSNRIYEAAAAGALIISDDNGFVHQFFDDSVFYLDRNWDEEKASARVMEILNWADEHPDEAYDMACRAQKIFLERLTLDQMVDEFITKTEHAIEQVHDRTLQSDIIDIICFVDEESDYTFILEQLRKQYYQNLHLIVISDLTVYKKITIDYPHDFVQKGWEDKGRCFADAIPLLQGVYFMFIDKHSIIHARHIYKNHELLSQRDELFVYSGCYLKRSQRKGRKYIVMNNKPISRNEFLLFSHSTIEEGTDWQYRDQQNFYIETIFPRSAPLFKKTILEYANNDELSLISDNVHMYLACCSIIKANQLGRFSYTLTTGYWGDSVREAEKRVFGHARRHWLTNIRSAKTYIKELNVIFFPYDLESDPNNVRPRNFNGEVTWFGEAPYMEAEDQAEQSATEHISWKKKLVRIVKKFIPKPIKTFLKKCIHA